MATSLFRVGLLLWPFLHTVADRAESNLTLRSKFGTKVGEVGFSQGYTQNSLCRQNNCVNPLFPGLNDLPRLEALTWQCGTNDMVQDSMKFCQDAVMYDPALPSPLTTSKSVAELVKSQDDAAMTMFVYHLAGMGYDAWDYRQPSQSDNDCVRSIWKMVCFTYFPRANAGCQKGQASTYQRPCKSSCNNYLTHCGVECCDESVQCAFTRTETNALGKTSVLQTGYVDFEGPSAMCTGGSRRTMSAPFLLILGLFGIQWTIGVSSASTEVPRAPMAGRRSHFPKQLPIVLLIIGCALCLQGCTSDHAVGNWRAQKNYLNEYSFLPDGAQPRDAILNSCAVAGTAATAQCSGRGYCKAFSTSPVGIGQTSMLAFCSCDLGWADPECSTPRKSQRMAFFLSLCFGMFGADYFYLGFPMWGLGKLLTLGGLGFWWLIDIVRIAAGPVYAYNFRTASDLPHGVAILILVSLCTLLGFLVSIETYFSYRKMRRDDMAAREHNEEESSFQKTRTAQLHGYGSTRTHPNAPHPNAASPYAAAPAGMQLLGNAGIPQGYATSTPMVQF